jgi:uncharacterized damage-inducible protein DinB
LSTEELALPMGAPPWPLWASVAHLAGGRVYWLCHVVGEPGVERTPFRDPENGWEDDLGHPRTAEELVGALASSWEIVERCLETWTPEMLGHEVALTRGGATRLHTLQSILWRILTHDAYHCGEIALTLGSHGFDRGGPNGPIDLWAGLSRPAP